ncbi:MAG: hypothetical protein LH618_09105 [Saprospiraceae bacterium]|nr:hypothetical protein [Saprospiraceae bacterium]
MLLLLADTRKRLLWLWLGFTATLILLVFVQTLTGKLEDIEAQAWVWIFAHLLPVLALLFAAVLLNKNPSKVLLRTTFLAIYLGALAYLLLVALTLLALPMAMVNWSIEEYLAKSYTWLLPFQVVLLLVFALLYFRKEPLFRPNAAIMQQYVAKKAEFAQRTGSIQQREVFDLLIADDGLGPTLDYLRDQTKINEDDVVMLQSQYTEWVNQRDLNLLPPEALQRDLNRMTITTIGYIEKL